MGAVLHHCNLQTDGAIDEVSGVQVRDHCIVPREDILQNAARHLRFEHLPRPIAATSVVVQQSIARNSSKSAAVCREC